MMTRVTAIFSLLTLALTATPRAAGADLKVPGQFVVTRSPRTCSGLAYCGVKRRWFVRVGIAYLLEQEQTRVDRQIRGVAARRDGRALHEFHDEIRLTVVGDAAVEQSRDAGVVHGGEDLPLALQAELVLGTDEMTGEVLERRLLLDAAVASLGAIHGAHAPGAAELDETPPALPRRGSRSLTRLSSRSKASDHFTMGSMAKRGRPAARES